MRGFIVLSLVVLSIALTFNYKDQIFQTATEKRELDGDERQELEKFAAKVEKAQVRSHEKQGAHKNKAVTSLTPFAFDPNTADSATLSHLGLRNWQISNILKYREKGGKWRRPDDFARLYGLSEAEFKQLRPFIKIKESKVATAKSKEKQKRDSIRATYPPKFEIGTILSLNGADTTTLKKIPGIGSYYAGKICRYRERLGGFVSIQQLKEIEGLPADIEKWFTLTTNDTIRKTKINHSSFKELVKHPYLNYEQVKVICNYIRKYGKIKSWDELSNSEHFTKTDFERLQPYSSFE